jgi:enoyl-[acyl-carrier-protein] reductase (NADH)
MHAGLVASAARRYTTPRDLGPPSGTTNLRAAAGLYSRTPTASIEKATMLGRAATIEDVGNAAAFAASDRGRTMTAATITSAAAH